MAKDGQYATPAIICSARCGICFTSGKCGNCDFARRYEVNKMFYEMVRVCPYKNREDFCNKEFAPCLGADCQFIMKAAERVISDGRSPK